MCVCVSVYYRTSHIASPFCRSLLDGSSALESVFSDALTQYCVSVDEHINLLMFVHVCIDVNFPTPFVSTRVYSVDASSPATQLSLPQLLSSRRFFFVVLSFQHKSLILLMCWLLHIHAPLIHTGLSSLDSVCIASFLSLAWLLSPLMRVLRLQSHQIGVPMLRLKLYIYSVCVSVCVLFLFSISYTGMHAATRKGNAVKRSMFLVFQFTPSPPNSLDSQEALVHRFRNGCACACVFVSIQ